MMNPLFPIRDYVTEGVYYFVCRFSQEHGYAPTYREIGKACDMTHVSAIRHADKLVALGMLRRTEGIARSLVVVDNSKQI